MNQVEIINETSNEIKELEEINNFIDFSLKYLNLDNVLFNIIIVTSSEIKQLNKDYRNKDLITDVISFALEDDKSFIQLDLRVLGDIYICYDRAKEQSISYGHSLLRELAFLSIHGLLHLLGYDHVKIEDENKMFELQEKILNEYGIKKEA